MSSSPLRLLRVVDASPTTSESPRLDGCSATADAVEAALLERARTGDVQAWGRLYQAHFDHVYRHLCFLTGSADLAEDLCQETFARAIVSITKFRGDSTLRTWLCRVALNVAREHWRKNGTRRKLRDELVELPPELGQARDIEATHLDHVRSKVLYGVLDTLPAHLREAFILRDLAGVPVDEVASQLGITPGNVAVRAHRARARIEKELTARGWLEGDDTP